MSDKAKMQLVVRRLEQIFTGKGDSSTKHSQSQQQQEVSQSAAIANRRETEARGHGMQPEGTREAKIISHCSDLPPTQAQRLASPCTREEVYPRGAAGRSDATPDQRPTRPLDLDPSRAQNHIENVKYMKHLGFGSPKMDPEKEFKEGEGWVYLNLLINMAQLHTVNVTQGFVRTAVIELSTKLEISADGRSIRWKGGHEGTRMTHESNASIEQSLKGSPDGFEFPRSRAADATSGNRGLQPYGRSPRSSGAESGRQPNLLDSCSSESHQFCKPILYRSAESEGDQDPSTENQVSTGHCALQDDICDKPNLDDAISARTVLESLTTNSVSGPIIFYRAGWFCTDLSRDAGKQLHSHTVYERGLEGVLGLPAVQDRVLRGLIGKGPLSAHIRCKGGNTTKETAGHATPDIQWPVYQVPRSGPTCGPLTLAASGLGGVRPEDNFTLQVQTHRPTTSLRKGIQRVSTRTCIHAPASLPSPSYAFLPHSLSSGDTEDNEDGSEQEASDFGSFGEREDSQIPLSPFLRTFSTGPARESAGFEPDDSSLSIELLAHARRASPINIAAKEDEYESRTMDDLPDADRSANSLVATAGELRIMDEGAPGGEEN